MNLPPPEHPCWSRLAAGPVAGFTTSQLAMQLLLKRVHTAPLSPNQKAAEVRAFFIKYYAILANEVAQLPRI